jgi:glycosyltransferase involved in cell wall biosynthesis
MNWPSVGVVIPTRNRPELLRRAIAAVRAQRYPGELKVVVVYDQTEPDYLLASTDGVPVLVLTNWRSSGLAGARNTGLLALDTELMAFCDDDDQWLPDKLRSPSPSPSSPPARSRSSTRAAAPPGSPGSHG